MVTLCINPKYLTMSTDSDSQLQPTLYKCIAQTIFKEVYDDAGR